MTGAIRSPSLFPSLRGFRWSWLMGDLAAATTLTAIAIPEQLATAHLAGMPAIAGLAAFAAGSLGFAALGTNRYMSVGADSTTAPILASALLSVAAVGSMNYQGLAATLALMVGACLIIAGLLRLGWIADLLSVPVTTGFLAGIGIQIVLGQIPTILGIPEGSSHLPAKLQAIAANLGEARIAPPLIGCGVLAAVMTFERLNPRIPGALIGVLAGGLAVWGLDLQHQGVAVLGALPVELPSPHFVLPNMMEFAQLVPAAGAVALICMVQTAAVAQSFRPAGAGREDASRDFAAVGAGSLLAALFGAFAVNASPPRTAVVEESGGRSQLAAILSVALVILVVLLASGLFAYLPRAALAGVLVFIGLRIIRVKAIRQIVRRGGGEIALVAASAGLVLFLPVQEGVAMAVLLSLVHGIYIVARPPCRELERVAGTTVWWSGEETRRGERLPGIVVFAPGAPIYFSNAHAICDALRAVVAGRPEPCRLVVLEASGVLDMDFTGAEVLRKAVTDLRAGGTVVAIARLSAPRAQRAAERSGLIDAVGPQGVHLSVQGAIDAFGAAPASKAGA